MKPDQPFNSGLLRMAGLSGVLAGVCVLAFAITAQSNGILFLAPPYGAAEIDRWMQNVVATPALSRVIMALPAIGFSCMLILIRVLRHYIAEESWQKTLAVGSYSIGVPVVVVTFVMQLSLMNEVVLHSSSAEAMRTLGVVASLQLFQFQFVNDVVGPLLVIVLGTAMMAWAALRANALPRWICFWLMTCGGLLAISFLGAVVPVLRILGLFAPLHMLGLVLLGVILLRRS